MENNKNLVYKFKPFEFEVLENKEDQSLTTNIMNYCVVSTDAYLIAYGGDGISEVVLKKYSFDLREWKIIMCQGIPKEFQYTSIALSGNVIIIYNSSNSRRFIPFHNVYIGNLADEYKKDGIKFEQIDISFRPLIIHRQFVVMESNYLFSISCNIFSDRQLVVRQLDLCTRKLEIFNAREHLPDFPQDIILYKNTIYIFGTNLLKFYTFNLSTKKWKILTAKEDTVPDNLKSYSFFQCTENLNLVYANVVSNGYMEFNDVWRCDLDILQWEKFKMFTLTRSMYEHSTTVTPSGRLCCYGGLVTTSSGIKNAITSAWITIPKLEIICWEAMIYYFKQQMIDSTTENLKKIGIPREFYNRIIEARGIKTSLGNEFSQMKIK